jgi:hypothetical protein
MDSDTAIRLAAFARVRHGLSAPPTEREKVVRERGALARMGERGESAGARMNRVNFRCVGELSRLGSAIK